jgi:hypothetical protein
VAEALIAHAKGVFDHSSFTAPFLAAFLAAFDQPDADVIFDKNDGDVLAVFDRPETGTDVKHAQSGSSVAVAGAAAADVVAPFADKNDKGDETASSTSSSLSSSLSSSSSSSSSSSLSSSVLSSSSLSSSSSSLSSSSSSSSSSSHSQSAALLHTKVCLDELLAGVHVLPPTSSTSFSSLTSTSTSLSLPLSASLNDDSNDNNNNHNAADDDDDDDNKDDKDDDDDGASTMKSARKLRHLCTHIQVSIAARVECALVIRSFVQYTTNS